MAGSRFYLSNFPQGFQTDVGLRNVPLILTSGARNVWVDSNGAGTGSGAQRRGTFQRPYATVAQAITSTSSVVGSVGGMQVGDTIFVKAGHVETLTGAGAWALATKNVAIIGIGQGDDRPQLTFSNAAASVLITAAGCSVKNVIGIAGAANTNPFNVQAAGTSLAIEWRDVTASTAEAVAVISATSAARNCFYDLARRGLGGGTGSVNSIKIVGTGVATTPLNVRINLDFYGNDSTSVVNFITNACKNVLVTGFSNNAASSGGTTKIVTDTITGSTFQCAIYNAATNPGTLFQGTAVAA